MVGGYAQLDRIISDTLQELQVIIPGAHKLARDVSKSGKPIVGVTSLGETYLATATISGYYVHLRVFVVGRSNNYSVDILISSTDGCELLE